MPIRISVPFGQKDEARALGAWWQSDEKTWIIPDMITDINPFSHWLPREEGFIVKWPHPVIKSERICWKCNRNTPLIALGSKSFYTLEYSGADESQWTYYEYPVLFTEIDQLDTHLTATLKLQFPFFQPAFSKTANSTYWANTCIHCKSLQGDNFNFMEENEIFCFSDRQAASFVQKDYLKLKFNYFISSGFVQATSNDWIL